MEHTKGELKIKECTGPQRTSILSERGEVCGIQGGVTASGFMPYEVLLANAERLVKCWNEHDELTEQRNELLHIVEQFVKGHESGAAMPLLWVIKEAKAAIAKAGAAK